MMAPHLAPPWQCWLPGAERSRSTDPSCQVSDDCDGIGLTASLNLSHRGLPCGTGGWRSAWPPRWPRQVVSGLAVAAKSTGAVAWRRYSGPRRAHAQGRELVALVVCLCDHQPGHQEARSPLQPSSLLLPDTLFCRCECAPRPAASLRPRRGPGQRTGRCAAHPGSPPAQRGRAPVAGPAPRARPGRTVVVAG